MILSVTEFKAKCLSLLERIRSSGETITLTRRGAVIAEVKPAAKPGGVSPQDSLRGSVKIRGDILGPVLSPTDWEAEGIRGVRKLAMKTLRPRPRKGKPSSSKR